MTEPPAVDGPERSPADAEAAGTAPRAVDLDRLAHAVRACGGDLVARAGLYLRLLQLEWAVERARLRRLALVALAGLGFLLGLLGAASMLWLAIFWDTPLRVPAAAVLAAAHAVGLGWAAWRCQALLRNGEQGFEATRRELAADLDLLRGTQ